MDNLLPHAYFNELLQCVLAGLGWILIAWMAFSAYIDFQRLKIVMRAHKRTITIPKDYIWQAKGSLTAELWRLLEITQLLIIGIWSVTYSTDNQPVIFWDWDANVNVWRVLAVTITLCKMMAALTARYYRMRINSSR
jgi:hypothetical protein